MATPVFCSTLSAYVLEL
ncbi:UNVERIFIED_CONTAM: hypothetical protein NCL1_49088 [Trichonephila clavipes]